MRRTLFQASLIGSVLLGLAGCSTGQAPLQLAPQVDLNRFYGRWYVIAEVPDPLEKSYVGSSVTYTPQPDGKISEDFAAHQYNFDGPVKTISASDHVVSGTNNAQLRTSFFWPVSFSEPILYVSPDYRYTIIGYPDRSLGWIYARTPTIDAATYDALLKRMQAEGYDIAKVRKIPQSRADLHQPGYYTPAF